MSPTSGFIPISAPVIGEREIAYVSDAVRSGWVSSIGPYIERFEAEFARYVGVRHAIAVSNGTVALHLALHALGVRSGDEVIVPDLTFAATAHAVLHAGASPVLVDVDQTWCMDPGAVERAMGARTKAIVPVHLYGHPADMIAIGELASRRNRLATVEDAAEAHGAEWHGRKVGSLASVAAFSFYGNKIITTGEGGMLTTDDDALAERMRFLKDHGMSKERRYFHTEVAFNYRMTNLQAALGLAQLERIEAFVAKKRAIFRWYHDALSDVPGIALNPEREGTRNVFWMTSVLLPTGLSRDAVSARLREQGIDTRPFFVPLSEMPHLAHCRRVGRSDDACPQSRELARRGINLPSGCALERDDVERAARALKGCVR
jgi:perosamine synthetase